MSKLKRGVFLIVTVTIIIVTLLLTSTVYIAGGDYEWGDLWNSGRT